MDGPKWYALKVVSGQEQKVKSYLEAELVRKKLTNYVTQILIPVEQVYELRGGKRKTKERNFFPGYILMCAELLDGRVSYIIRSIPGALGFLSTRGCGSSKKPVPLRQTEVNRILGRIDEGVVNDTPLGSSFIVGEIVKVIAGPFSGFSGSIQEVFEERKKLNIAVKIFERNTPVELSYAQVEKLA